MSRLSLNIVMVVTNDAVSDPRVTKEARALVGGGNRVTVLAWDRTGEACGQEERDGVTYERLGPRAPYGSGWRALPRFMEFWRLATRRALELAADVVHCHDLDTAVVGLRFLQGRPQAHMVLDHHELYRHTKMVPQRGIVGVVARFLVDALDRRAVRSASVVVVANPGNVERYERMAPGKVVSVENAPDVDLFVPQEKHSDSGTFKVCFIGQKRYMGSLQCLIDVVARHPEMSALIAGGGVCADEVERAAADISNVQTMGRVSYEEIPGLYAGCDVVYAMYDSRVGNIRTAFPVKAFEGMAYGIPVLVDAGTWIADFVEAERIGLAVRSLDERAIESALCRLAENPAQARAMGERGRKIIMERLNWQAAAFKLLAAYADIPPADLRPGGDA